MQGAHFVDQQLAEVGSEAGAQKRQLAQDLMQVVPDHRFRRIATFEFLVDGHRLRFSPGQSVERMTLVQHLFQAHPEKIITGTANLLFLIHESTRSQL